jgi:hypothetical protein
VQKQIKFFGFTSGVKPKVSKLLRRHFRGESGDKEEVAPTVGAGWKDMWNHGASPRGSNILRMVQGAREAVVTVQVACRAPGARKLWVTGTGLYNEGSLRSTTK